MFDTSKQFQIRIQSGGPKTAIVRWPTDQEWAERARRRKTVRRFLGRGKSQAEVLDRASADRMLWDKIVIEPAHEYDDAEIAAFIGRLEYTDVLSVERHGEQFVIEMQVTDLTRGGEPVFVVTHTLRMPTQAQVQQYGRSSQGRVDGRREQTTIVRLEAGGELYDAVLVAAEGYSGAVPLPHKDDAVMELLQSISVTDEDDPEQ